SDLAGPVPPSHAALLARSHAGARPEGWNMDGRGARGSDVFTVRVYQRIVAVDARGWAERELRLPFVPFPGLALLGISRADEVLEIAAVTWDVREGLFRVNLDKDSNNDHETIADLLQFYGPVWSWTPQGERARDGSR